MIVRRTLLLFPLSFLLVACPPATGTDDGGQGPGDGGTQGDGGGPPDGGDGGAPDAGPAPCTSDWDDCGPTEVCDLVSGKCVEGHACNPQYGYANCNYDDMNQQSPGWGCGGSSDEDCVCDPEGKVCKKRREMCTPCTADAECGDLPTYTDQAFCVEYQGERVCLQKAGNRGCPQGYEPDAMGTYCVPAGGATCESVFVCTSDADCPASRPVCNLTTGTCTRGCVFDLETGESTCPTGKVCDHDGKCRAPCDPANDTCADIDPSFVCKVDVGNVARCRPAGCIDDVECEVPDTSPYLGFCDLTNNTCVTDRCRPEKGLGADSPDCRLPYGCNEQGQCYLMDCVERGGAALACQANQFCCGECRNVTGNPSRDSCDPLVCNDLTPAPEPALPGCVLAPNPPWCRNCSDHDACASYANPKEDPRDPNLCLPVGMQQFCALTCETAKDCPTMWQCQHIQVPCDPGNPTSCGGGTCVDDGPWGADCTTANDCPQDWDCVTDPSTNTKKCHVATYRCECSNDNECPSDVSGLPPGPTRCQEVGFMKNRCVVSKVCVPQGTACQ